MTAWFSGSCCVRLCHELGKVDQNSPTEANRPYIPYQSSKKRGIRGGQTLQREDIGFKI